MSTEYHSVHARSITIMHKAPKPAHGTSNPLAAALAGLSLGTLLALGSGAAAQTNTTIKLPDFGDSSEAILSSADDSRLGEAFIREVRASVEVIDDPEVETYIQNLGYRISSGDDARDHSFYFFMVKDDAINAFAGPGGYIGAHTGLILATESEGELASVLAHETAHVTQRHIARAYENANRNNIPALAGIIAAIALGAVSGSPDAGIAAASAVAGLQVQSQIDLIRANEKEADRVGMDLLSKAGFDPRAMPSFFEKLQTSSRYYRTPPEFLSTHPVTTSRIADSRARAERYDYRQTPGSFDYHLTKAKIRVLTASSPQVAVDYFTKTIESGSHGNADAAAYGLGLSLAASRRYDQATQVLAKLEAAYPREPRFKSAMAGSALDAGNVDAALEQYARAYSEFPDSKAVVFGYANALLRAKRGAQALDITDDYARAYGREARLYKLEADAYAQTGRDVDSQLALAEHLYLSGRLEAAINQLRQAGARARENFYDGSRIAARLKSLEDERIQRAQR